MISEAAKAKALAALEEQLDKVDAPEKVREKMRKRVQRMIESAVADDGDDDDLPDGIQVRKIPRWDKADGDTDISIEVIKVSADDDDDELDLEEVEAFFWEATNIVGSVADVLRIKTGKKVDELGSPSLFFYQPQLRSCFLLAAAGFVAVARHISRHREAYHSGGSKVCPLGDPCVAMMQDDDGDPIESNYLGQAAYLLNMAETDIDLTDYQRPMRLFAEEDLFEKSGYPRKIGDVQSAETVTTTTPADDEVRRMLRQAASKKATFNA